MEETGLAAVSLKLKVSVIFVISCLAYSRIATAPFLHDDNPAVLDNPDVQEKSTVLELFKNDFWGTNICRNESHKSYRPITVLLFRFLHMLWKNWSVPYHVTNIILHSIVSILFFFVCRKIIFPPSSAIESLVAGLLFALHPVHTEAVCGVVGCAELLSALFFMMTLLLYCGNPPDETRREKFKCSSLNMQENKWKRADNTTLRHRKSHLHKETDQSKNATETRDKEDFLSIAPTQENSCSLAAATSLAFLSAAIGMLCKESGVTVLGVGIIFEFTRIYKKSFSTNSNKILIKIFATVLWGLLLIAFRMRVMEWTYPRFSKSDNPAAHEEDALTRVFTYLYLCWYNFRLLLFPINLCYDYSFKTITLITSIWDVRNLCFPSLCFGIGVTAYFVKIKIFVMGFSLMFFPFIPASNLFFSVGFVIAERILYLPSAGFIVIAVTFWSEVVHLLPSLQRLLKFCMLAILLIYFTLTLRRCYDWTTKERLFRSGVVVAPTNPKIRYNWANYLRETNNVVEAAAEYEKVLELEPTYVSAINNLATILEDGEKSMNKAEALYARAIQIEPTHENAYSNLAKIMMKQNRYEEATKVLVRAAQTIPGNLFYVTSLAKILVKRDRLTEAEQVLSHLIKKSCLKNEQIISKSCPSSHLPALKAYADLKLKQGNIQTSIKIFVWLLKLNDNDEETAVGLSRALIASGETDKATKILIKQYQKHNSTDADYVWRSAAALFQSHHYQQSKRLYELYTTANPHNIEAMGQYAALLFQMGDRKIGKQILLNVTSADDECSYSGTWRNLATIFGLEKRHDEAINLLTKCIIRNKDATNIDQAWKKQKALTLHELAKHKIDHSKQLLLTERNTIIMEQNAMEDLLDALSLDPTNNEVKALVMNLKRKLKQ